MQAGLYKRYFAAAMFLGGLSGCSVSPAVDAASWTVDGISYLLTGKAAVDHAVSAMARQDCAMIRMIRDEIICVPRDEDVVGDRLVFRYERSSWSAGSVDPKDTGDPLRVNPAIADLMQPLGGAVQIEGRSTAVAAVAADPVPIRAMIETNRQSEGWTARLSGLVKSKPTMPAAAPDRATRLWLPVE